MSKNVLSLNQGLQEIIFQGQIKNLSQNNQFFPINNENFIFNEKKIKLNFLEVCALC